jgi:hypothetical protein
LCKVPNIEFMYLKTIHFIPFEICLPPEI